MRRFYAWFPSIASKNTRVEIPHRLYQLFYGLVPATAWQPTALKSLHHSAARSIPTSLNDRLISQFISFFSFYLFLLLQSCLDRQSHKPKWLRIHSSAITNIHRGRACETRMWITRVSSGTNWSVVLLCYLGQDHTEGKKGDWDKGNVQRKVWEGQEERNWQQHFIVYNKSEQYSWKIYFFHSNNPWNVDLISRFSANSIRHSKLCHNVLEEPEVNVLHIAPPQHYTYSSISPFGAACVWMWLYAPLEWLNQISQKPDCLCGWWTDTPVNKYNWIFWHWKFLTVLHFWLDCALSTKGNQFMGY